MKRDARGISFSLCGHSLTRAWDGRFWKMRFLVRVWTRAVSSAPRARHNESKRNDLRLGVRKKQLSAIYRAKTKRTQEHLCSVALWNTL